MEKVIRLGNAIVDKELFDKFCILGYIKTGVDANMRGTYRVTPFGKKQIENEVKLMMLSNS